MGQGENVLCYEFIADETQDEGGFAYEEGMLVAVQ